MKNKRPNWDEYFLNVMDEVAKRATCDRGKSAAIIVKNKRILTTGYVGSPIGMDHCDELGHLMIEEYDKQGSVKKHCVRTVHAEQNALVQAARFGISVDGATIYSSMEPCFVCAKMIINAGIKRVVAKKKYHAAELSREFLKKAEVELVVIEDTLMEYKDQ